MTQIAPGQTGNKQSRLTGPAGALHRSWIPANRPSPALLPLWLSLLVAAAGGVALDAGSPDKGWWPVAFLGIAAVLVSLIGRRWGSALLVGVVAGFSFWGVHISWLTLYLGIVPWLALSILQTLFFGFGAVLIAVVYRNASRTWPQPRLRLLLLPIVIAGLWTAREALTAVWPEGGFSWGRVVFTQSESPVGSLVAWVGFSGTSFVMVWLVAFVIEVTRNPTLVPVRKLTVSLVAIVALFALPAWYAPTTGTTRVAAVQGNTDAGLFAQRYLGDIMNDQVDATLPLFGHGPFDMVVWPENGSDLDPTRNAEAAKTLDYLSRQLKAPLVVGTITNPSADVYFNSSLLWKAGQGAVSQYDKRHPVPFAEYMPLRDFFHALAPDLVNLVTRDYQKGTTSTVFDINGVIAGISICFDITDDAVAREMMGEGAQLILAQTNNADFGKTDENLQQLAIARLRAIETGRSLVNISTVGTSQIVAPNGSTITGIEPYTAGAMVADVPLATVNTPATLFGQGIELLVSGLGLAGFVLAVMASRRHRRDPAS